MDLKNRDLLPQEIFSRACHLLEADNASIFLFYDNEISDAVEQYEEVRS
jgi:hypothetical protein